MGGVHAKEAVVSVGPFGKLETGGKQEEIRGKINVDTNLALGLSVDVSAQVLCCILRLGSPVTRLAAWYLQGLLREQVCLHPHTVR